MTISKNNTRTLITIPKELKEQLETLSKSKNRSLNNLIITYLKECVEKDTCD